MKLFRKSKQVLAFTLIAALMLSSVLLAGAYSDYPGEDDLGTNTIISDQQTDVDYDLELSYDNDNELEIFYDNENDLELSYSNDVGGESSYDNYLAESGNHGSPQYESDDAEKLGEVEVFDSLSDMLTVVFNGNGGIISDGQGTRTVRVGTSITNAHMPTIPSRVDWTFRGWTKNADGSGGAFTGTTVVTGAMANAQGEVHVYAQWGHAVRFFGNPTVLPGSDDHAIAGNQNLANNWGTRVVPDNTSVNLAEEMVWPNDPPARVGRTFVGWFSTNAATGGYVPGGAVGEGFTGDTPITTRVDLFARWVLNDIYTVTFDAGSGSSLASGHSQVWQAYGGMTVLQSSRIGGVEGAVATESELLNQGNVPAIPPPPTTPGLPSVTPREGLTHVGWSTIPNPPTANFLFHGTGMSINSNITVHAVWVHRVTFNGHTGLASGNSQRNIPEADSGQSIDTHGRFSGLSTGGSPFVTLNADIVGMPDNPVRPGFEFIGWTTNWTGMSATNNYFTDRATAEARINFDGSTSITSNTAVHAVWLRNPDRTVTFHSNGGSALDWNTAVIPDGGTQVALGGAWNIPYRYFPIHPTRDGFIFMGWYIGNEDNDGGNGGILAYRYRTDTIVNDDLHIWAHWVPAVTITFMPNGGGGTPQTANVPLGMTWNNMAVNLRSTTWGGGYGLTSDPAAHMPGFTEPLNHAPIESHLRNTNWNTTPDGTGMVFNANTVVTENMTVYRVWFVNVTFNNNHTRFAPGAPDFTHNTHNTIVSGYSFNNNHMHGNTAVNPPAFRTITNWAALPIAGFSFVGFNTNRNAEPTAATGWIDANTILSENVELFAIFSPGVVFNSGAAPSAVILPQHRERIPDFMGQQIQDSPGGMPPDPVWLGQVFYGWNTNIDGTGTRIFGTSTVGATLRVYAIWDSTITFDGNGGMLHPSTVSPIVARAGSLFGGILPTATNLPTRANYLFTGWNTKPDGSGMVITATTPVGASTTLYAQWAPVVMHTVTFNLNGGTQAVGEDPALLIQLLQSGDNARMIANPTRPGYNFVSWVVDPVGATVINVQGDITFTANWTQIVLPTLTGTVMCDETDDLISDVTVRLYKNVNGVWQYLRSVQTNQDGFFDFGEVPLGNIRVIKDYDTIPTGHVVILGGNRYLTTLPAGAYEEHFRIAPAPPPPCEKEQETPSCEEEQETPPPGGASPQTGDKMSIVFHSVMFIASMIMIFLINLSAIAKKRRRI